MISICYTTKFRDKIDTDLILRINLLLFKSSGSIYSEEIEIGGIGKGGGKVLRSCIFDLSIN